MRYAPALLGLFTVAQNVLNRQIADRWGLSATVVLNAATLLASTTLLLLVVSRAPQLFPDIFRAHPTWESARWWFVVPGLCGCLFTTGMPWAISRYGAAQVFVLVVAGQMVFSLAYDALVEGRPVTAPRAIGAGLAVAGALLMGRG